MNNFVDYFVAFGLSSAMLYFFFFIPLRRVIRARVWIETPCVILSSSVEEDQTESGIYRILVSYMYEFTGRSYSSNRYDFSTGGTCGLLGKKAVAKRLAPGTRTVCYVDPTDPAEAVLRRGVTWDILFWGVFSTILLIAFSFSAFH